LREFMEPRSLGKRRHVARAGVATIARASGRPFAGIPGRSRRGAGPLKKFEWRRIGSQALPLDAVKPCHTAG
jgi:hypothetical protein